MSYTHYTSFLGHFIRQQKWGFLLLVVCQLAWTIDQSVMPYAFKVLTDTLITIEDKATAWQQLTLPLILIAFLWVVTDIMYRVYDFTSAKVYPRMEAAIRREMFEYVSAHSPQFFADNFAGNIANKIADMSASTTRIMQLLITLFIPSALAVVVAISLFSSVHPLFGSVLGLWIVLHIGVALLFAKRCNEASIVHAQSRSRLVGQIVDSFSNYMNVTLFARRSYERGFIRRFQEEECALHHRALRVVAMVRLLQGVMCFLLSGVVLTGAMIHMWVIGILTVSDVVYIFYASWSIVVVAWISGIELPNFFKEWGICRQAMQVMMTPHDVVDVKEAKDLTVSKGKVTFNNVTFGYGKKKPLFEGKHVSIEPGQKVGLVGESGGGKTSFVNLILRLYEVRSGSIEIDGQDISQVTLASLRDQIAMIPQEPTLFHRSLMDNIRYGCVDASDDAVIEAAKKARCHAFITQLEEGYDTLVGERGIKLSGGQRQRIAIARAILKNAPIIILDEATSALDSVTEQDIQAALHDLMQGRTVIVIAHRLSTLTHMDRVLVFDRGSIVEDGTHEALLKDGNHYATLWNMQSHGFIVDEE